MANGTTLLVERGEDRAWARNRQAGLRRYALILLALLVVSVGYNIVIVNKLPGMSAIDGAVYTDAFDRALTGGVTVRGDVLADRTLNLLACRGAHGVGSIGMTCGPDQQAVPDEARSRFDLSYTSAYVHPPTYFLTTAAVVRVAQWVLPGEADDFDLARIVGALWFSLGALLLIRAAALWGASPWAAALVLLAFLPTPTFLTLFSFITPDAMGLMVGGAVVLGMTLWWQRRMPAWPLLFFGMATAAVKLTYVVTALAAVAVLASLWYGRRTRGVGETVRAAAWLLGGTAVAVLGWRLAVGIIATVETLPVGSSGPFVLQPSLDSILSLLVVPGAQIPTQAAGTAIPFPTAVGAAAFLLAMLTAGAAGGALIYTRRTSVRFALAAGGVIAVVLAGLIVSVLTFASDGVLLPVAPRYAFGAWPFYVLPLLLLARRRWVTVLVAVIVVVSMTSWVLWPVHPAI